MKAEITVYREEPSRHSGQSVHLRVSIDGVERIAAFVGDPMIVATAAGSTA